MDSDNILEALNEYFEYDSSSEYNPTSSVKSSGCSENLDSDICINDTYQNTFSNTSTENSQQWNNITSMYII